MSSRYGAFLESYNSGNQNMDRLIYGFFERISFDLEQMTTSQNSFVASKTAHAKTIINDPSKANYDKLLDVVNILSDLSYTSIETSDKKNFANIVNSLIDIAKSSEDSLLIDKALQISSQLAGLPA